MTYPHPPTPDAEKVELLPYDGPVTAADIEWFDKFISAMCNGDRASAWRMCIPVQRDDSDMVCARILRHLKARTPNAEAVNGGIEGKWQRCNHCMTVQDENLTDCLQCGRGDALAYPFTPVDGDVFREFATSEAVTEPMADGYHAWLIELKGVSPTYYREVTDDNWTPDHNKALHFCRKQDAESVIAFYGWTDVFASEHLWTSPPQPDTAKLCAALDQSLRQWRMYSETQNATNEDLDDADTPEGVLYRQCKKELAFAREYGEK